MKARALMLIGVALLALSSCDRTAPLRPATIRVTPETLTIVPDSDFAVLKAEVFGEDGGALVGDAVTWTSSDSSTISVSSTGVLRSHPWGYPHTATITAASVADPNVRGSAVVYTKLYPQWLAIVPTTAGAHLYRGIATLTPGSAIRLSAVAFRDLAVTTRYPTWDSSITDQRTTWASRSPEIATVDVFGTVVAKSPGRATIVAASVEPQGARDSVWVVVLASAVQMSKVVIDDAACGLSSGGQAYCWGGVGVHGELGDGTVLERDFPAFPVAGERSFTTLSVGNGGLDFAAHICGIATDGVTYCWGFSPSGQAGTGTTGMVLQPTAVAAPVPFVSVAAGSNHSCGLAETGDAYCWGANGHHELGDSTTIARSQPVLVKGGMHFASLALGLNSCGLDATGRAYCWGWNLAGSLGTGSAADQLTPAPVAGTQRFVQLVGGVYHMCGLATTGQAYCWGDNESGQLGDGSSTSRDVPTPVTGGITFASLAASSDNTCGLTSDGEAYCWGWNGRGYVGDGTSTNRSSPARVAGGHRFTSLDAGRIGVCGVATDGVWCWGMWQPAGSDGAPSDRSVPSRLLGTKQ